MKWMIGASTVCGCTSFEKHDKALIFEKKNYLFAFSATKTSATALD